MAGDIIVTAQKRSERLRDVGMSIQAITPQALSDAGIASPKDLVKIVPGFSSSNTPFGTSTFTLRGIGFQETSLAAGPTVTVYTDEVPIPFSPETAGVAMDLERVEVLKGPQGTLYGQNSTGGLVNFLSARPTDRLSYGGRISVDNFGGVEGEGHVSGAITDTLKARVAFKFNEGGAWQKSYTRDAKLGDNNLLNGRVILEWEPSSKFHATFTLNAWRDHGETPAPQFFGAALSSPAAAPLVAFFGSYQGYNFLTYPAAPHNNRYVDWDANTDFHRRNSFVNPVLRLKYDLTSDISLTSITSYQHFKRDQPVEGDGTALTDLTTIQRGDVKSWYQELRLGGTFGGRGSWLIGGNYEHDKVFDQFHLVDPIGSQGFIGQPFVCNLGLGVPCSGLYHLTGNFVQSDQRIATSAVFANVEYPLTDRLTVQAAVRYTRAIRNFTGGAFDGSDGQTAALFTDIQNTLRYFNGLPPSGQVIGLKDCFSFGAAPTYTMGCRTDRLSESNVSWRAGLNYKVNPDTLLYANVSRGYKAGSFPTVVNSLQSEMDPVTQEKLTAYEAGIKTSLADHTLDLTLAGFYYDYRNKQTLTRFVDPLFGVLLKLGNIPKSRVVGFEAAVSWRPIPGLSISPMISYTDSKVLDDFMSYDYLGNSVNLKGSPFPLAPRVQGALDTQYRWQLGSSVKAFLGGNLTVQGVTHTGLVPNSVERVPPYALLDLRAGIETGSWRFSVWARNVTDKWYWNSSTRINDALVRQAGTPRTIGVTLGFDY
ncbi:MAG TPA: TonB-dependent receptor [Sphingomonas sp.]